MTYPEEYKRGYVNTAIGEFRDQTDDCGYEAFMAGYKHFNGLVRDLFAGIQIADLPLLFCVLSRHMQLARNANPRVDQAAKEIADVVTHNLGYAVVPINLKRGENDDYESKDQH